MGDGSGRKPQRREYAMQRRGVFSTCATRSHVAHLPAAGQRSIPIGFDVAGSRAPHAAASRTRDAAASVRIWFFVESLAKRLLRSLPRKSRTAQQERFANAAPSTCNRRTTQRNFVHPKRRERRAPP